jgi:hypothetical protein
VVEGVLSTCKTLSFNHHQKPKNNKTKTKQQHTNKAAECQPEDCSAMNDKEKKLLLILRTSNKSCFILFSTRFFRREYITCQRRRRRKKKTLHGM